MSTGNEIDESNDKTAKELLFPVDTILWEKSKTCVIRCIKTKKVTGSGKDFPY